MKVFLSWSGEDAKKVALALRFWLPNVIQALDPWCSDQDVSAGSFWSSEIRHEVADSNFAIIVVTPFNYAAPWLNYEAGAIAERLGGWTCPYLVGFEEGQHLPGDSPLSLLQSVAATKAGTFVLLKTINRRLAKPISPGRLRSAFDAYWANLGNRIDTIVSDSPTVAFSKPAGG